MTASVGEGIATLAATVEARLPSPAEGRLAPQPPSAPSESLSDRAVRCAMQAGQANLRLARVREIRARLTTAGAVQ